jgi:ABC-type branched-subunit amino acid transport system substrate-binding protein
MFPTLFPGPLHPGGPSRQVGCSESIGGIRLRRHLLLVAIVSGLLVASGGLSSAFSAVPASAATSSVPIVVGGDGDAALNEGTAQGFEAGIYRFNKSGGLDGRKIEYLGFLDDAFSPQTALTNAEELVQDKHAMFVAPLVSEVAGASVGDLLAEAKVPFLGWAESTPFQTEPKWGYGIDGLLVNPAVEMASQSQYLVATGDTKDPSKFKLAYIGVDYASAITGVKALAGVSRYLGMKVVLINDTVPVLGSVNYVPYVQAVLASGANAVYEALGTADAIGLAAALHAGGYKGIIINGVTYLPGSLASNPSEESALQGVYVGNTFPANQNDTPAAKQEEKDLKSIGQPPYLTTGVSIGYWSAIVLEQMLRATLKKVGGNPNLVTGAAVEKMVNSGFTYTDPIPGGIGTEYFPAAERVPNGCSTLLQTVGAGFKAVAPYQCLGDVNVVKDKRVNIKTGEVIP